MSYGNFKGRSEKWWRRFIRQCHVAGYVNKELKSIIKKSGHYAIQGVYHVLPKAIDEISNEDTSVLLCRAPSVEEMSCSESVQSTSRQGDGPPSKQQTSIRVGKGTHGLVTVRKLLEDKENWVIPKNDADWQFPGVFSDTDKHEQCVLFIEDYRSVYPTCPKNLDFLWLDIQLEK